MAMHYLIQQNDIYMDKMEEFDRRIDDLMDLIRVMKYNIDELQVTVKSLRTTDAEDLKFHAKEEMSFLAKLLPSLYHSQNKN